jgi:hypothetical protein
MEKQAKVATSTAATTTEKPPQVRRKAPPAKPLRRNTPMRRAGDTQQPWQLAELKPGAWPYPAPVHGEAGLTWAVLPTGETVKWSDLGMDRRLDERVKVWRGEEKTKLGWLKKAMLAGQKIKC